MTFVRYWTPLLLYCCLIVGLSSQPGTNQRMWLWEWLAWINLSDGILHSVEYFALGLLSCRALAFGTTLKLQRGEAWVATALFALLFGSLDEVYQSFVPHRSLDFADLLADVLGASCAAALYVTFNLPRENVK